MTDPLIQVTDKDVLAMLGALYVELQMTRAQLAAAQAQQKPQQPDLEVVK